MARQPQQERARRTAEAIVEAGFRATARYGAQGATMRQIADIAGVGVASLYEYYEDRDALFKAMGERFAGDVTRMIKDITPTLVRIPIRQAVFELIHAFEELLRRQDGVYLKCANQGLFLDQAAELQPIYKALIELFSQHTMYHPEHLRLQRLNTMTYIFLNSGVFTLVRYMSNPAPHFSFDDLANGMADMVGHYVDRELQINGLASASGSAA